jgi:hypothetical protein
VSTAGILYVTDGPQQIPGTGIAGAPPVQLINLDDTNTAYYGYSGGIAPESQVALPLGPLASIVVSSAGPVWIVAAEPLEVAASPGASGYSPGSLTITGPVTAEITGTVAVNVQNATLAVTGSVDAEVTGSVEISGTPDVTFTNDIINVTGDGGAFPPGDNASLYTGSASIMAGGSLATGIVDGLMYNSYNLAVSCYCSAQANAGAPMVAMVQIVWYADAAGSTTLFTDTWWTWVANSSPNVASALGSGPMHGRYFQAFVYHEGSAETLSCSALVVYGTQRTLSKPVWRQGVPAGISSAAGFTQLAGLSNAAAAGTDDVLANLSNQGLSASTKYFVPMPLSAGPVYLRFETSATLAGNAAVCSANGLTYGQIGGTSGTDPNVLYNSPSVASTDYEVNIVAGHAPLFLTVSASTGPPTVNFMAISQDAG